MSLLECLVAIALSSLLLSSLLQTSANLLFKQIQSEKSHALTSEAERAMELMGRAIRMAGYRNIQSTHAEITHKNRRSVIEIQKGVGYQKSDSLVIKHELSDGVDFDCIGNVLTLDRTNNHLALQGFLIQKQSALPKGAKGNGGSLICQSLDRQGRIQNTTLMNGVNTLTIEEVGMSSNQGQQTFKVKLQMTDGALLQRDFERTFTTRNLP
jgi:hypothetical protein